MPKGLFGNKSQRNSGYLVNRVMAVVSEQAERTENKHTHTHTDFGAKIKEIDEKHF